MRSNLLKKAGLCRTCALMLMLWCGISAAFAIESDDINAAILVEGSVPVKWTNDATHPWYIVESTDGNYIRTPETPENSAFTSTLSFTYTSTYPTEITFVARRGKRYNDDKLSVKIDGEVKSNIQDNSWTNYKYKLPAGSHTVEFVSVSIVVNSSDAAYYSGIKNMRVWECKELETQCLAEGSLPLTFENDPDNMWIADNGYIRSTSRSTNSSQVMTSKISTTFTIDKPSLFSYEIKDSRGYRYDYETYLYIDGEFIRSHFSDDWAYKSYVLYPGTHTIEFENRHNTANRYDTRIRNVRLDQTWYDVSLDNPGELDIRLAQALQGKNLQDAELVKINGAMNAADWATIKQLSGVKAIDFTGTNITNVPSEGLRGLSYLSTVMLPETVKSIGYDAFRGTDFHQITIPASVESIGSEAWRGTPIEYITFEPSSKLSFIGYCAFYGTALREFTMPDSVTEIGTNSNYSYLFYECTSLRKLHLSDNLTYVPVSVAEGCTSLVEVNIPSKATQIGGYAFKNTSISKIEIPSTVWGIGREAFLGTDLEVLNIPSSVTFLGCRMAYDCKNLKEVTLSSNSWDMERTFEGCTALQTVFVPCATPPSIESDPFYGVTKDNVKLMVPDFAVEAYGTDPYWYQFTTRQASDEVSLSDYWAIRGNLTLDDKHVMQGTPSVDLVEGGTLTMDSNAVQNFDTFTYSTSESSPAAFLSKSNNVKANKLVTGFYVDTKDKWLFFSPVTDVRMSEITYPATDSWVIRYYDGARRASENSTSGNWINVPADSTLRRGHGYIIQARKTGWLNMPAAPEEHDKFFGSAEVTLPLDDNACETKENAGWNFVANPYPCYYDIYHLDMQAPITVWTGSTYCAYSLNDNDRADDNFLLRPMQPFFVQKSVANLTASMPLEGCQVNTLIDRTRAPRPVTVDENRHKLNLEMFRGESDEADDYTRIVINEKASAAYETVRDASKFMSMDSNVAQLYSLGEENHPMAINERPYESGSVALGVYIPTVGETYRIAARRADRQAWIYDAETGIEQDLTEGDYVFTASKTGVDNTRFTIRFAPGTTSVEGIEASAVKVAGKTGVISISAPAGTMVAVYAADGTLVADMTAENGIVEVPAAAGIYVVKAAGRTVKTIVK